MKYLIIILFSLNCFSQSVADPRIRVSCTPNLLLTTSWQTINFNGSESLDTNTFGMDPVSGNRIFNYNTTTALFNYYGNYDNNFFTSFQFTTTTTLLTVKATLQIRFVIPNGTSPGVDFVFPFTNNGGYADLTDITILSTPINNTPFDFDIYTNGQIRANGFKIQVKLSNALAIGGTTTLNYASMRIQGISKN
jgi:hypothetical protein